MTTPSRLVDRVRRVGWRALFGPEWNAAKSAHWTTQWYPGWRVQEIQWEAVAAMVAHARAAQPFYRDRLAVVSDISTLTPELFQQVRPLTRTDLIAAASVLPASAASAGLLRRRSGGSSGRSVGIPLNRATYAWYLAGTWRGLRWWGADFSDRGLILLGSGSRGLQRVAVRAKDWVMNWRREPVDDRFQQRAPAILKRLAAFRPAFIYGYPSAVYQLARAAQGEHAPARRRLKVIVLTGEPLYAYQRQSIQETFECPVAEEYGNGEVGSMAFQCPEGQLHVTAENVYLETPPAHDGGAGRILATQLRNRLFPLIRYETGDVGEFHGAACPCKRGLPVIRVWGRAGERLIHDGDAVLARPEVDRLLSALPERLQGRVQVVHPKPGCLVLRVERNGRSQDDSVRAAAAGAAVFGPQWRIGTVEVDRLTRLPSGKLPQFVEQQNQQ